MQFLPDFLSSKNRQIQSYADVFYADHFLTTIGQRSNADVGNVRQIPAQNVNADENHTEIQSISRCAGTRRS